MGQKVKRGNYEKRKNGNEGEIILHDTKEVKHGRPTNFMSLHKARKICERPFQIFSPLY